MKRKNSSRKSKDKSCERLKRIMKMLGRRRRKIPEELKDQIRRGHEEYKKGKAVPLDKFLARIQAKKK